MPRKREGKHPDKALNATQVRNLTRPGRYADGNGLYLFVEPSGTKRWVLRTVIKGKRCDVGLGGASVVGLADARETAAEMRKVARANGDPLADRQKQRRVVPTFEDAAREVHKAHSPSFRNVKHREQWINTLIEYVFPVFGSRQVDHVEPANILKALSPIWLVKPETARRVRQRIKSVFDWTKAARYRSGDNPVEGVSKALPKQRDDVTHHVSLSYGDVPKFLAAVRGADVEDSMKLVFEFLILTSTRTSEVLGARWDEFNLKEKTWTIPADRMKAHRIHRVPLSARCLAILASARKLSDVGKVAFPDGSSDESMSNMAFHTLLRRIKQKGITAHGFRPSFRNWAAEKTNFPREVCEMALAHILKDEIEAAYNRTDLFERRRKLMEAWEAFAVASSGTVVRFRV